MLCDIESGKILKTISRPHPDGTEVDPAAWWSALQDALKEAEKLGEIAAISIGGRSEEHTSELQSH